MAIEARLDGQGGIEVYDTDRSCSITFESNQIKSQMFSAPANAVAHSGPPEALSDSDRMMFIHEAWKAAKELAVREGMIKP